MSADMLLDELADLGIHLEREGEAIFATAHDRSDITLHAERIKAHKLELLAALELRERIIAALDVEPEDFKREEYDRRWVIWHARDANEESASLTCGAAMPLPWSGAEVSRSASNRGR